MKKFYQYYRGKEIYFTTADSITQADSIPLMIGFDQKKATCHPGFRLVAVYPEKVKRKKLSSERIVKGKLCLPDWYYDTTDAIVDLGWYSSFDDESLLTLYKKYGKIHIRWKDALGHLRPLPEGI